jgi:dihydroorotase
VAIPVVTGIFEAAGALPNLESFTSVNGAVFYGMPLNDGTLTIDEVAWKVPEAYGEFVPLCAGELLRWRVTSSKISWTGLASEGR